MDTKKAEKAILKKLQSRLKLVIVGDGCVGKTSLLFAYGAKQFLENHEPTVFENYVTTVQLSNKKEVSGEMVEMSLWDTAGQEDLDRLRPLSYSDADIILICFAVTDTTSFLNVANKWVPEIRHYCPHAPVLLVATKKDLRPESGTKAFVASYGQGALQTEEGKTMSTRVRAAGYLECSSKTFEGVETVFAVAADLAMKYHKKSSSSCVLQ